MQDVPDCRRYAVIFPFTDDQPCCSVEDCLKLTQMNVIGASQYPVAVIYPANNQGVHQNRHGFRGGWVSDGLALISIKRRKKTNGVCNIVYRAQICVKRLPRCRVQPWANCLHIPVSQSSIIWCQPMGGDCGWEGNRRSGVALATRHKLTEISGSPSTDSRPWNFQWPWRTPNPVFKVTAFLKYNIWKTVHLRNSVSIEH